MNDDQRQTSRNWIDEAEDALSRTGEALKTAWNETKETRMATLEAAREAAARLGKAIDQGIEAARGTWDSAEQRPPADAGSAESRTESSSITPDEIQEAE